MCPLSTSHPKSKASRDLNTMAWVSTLPRDIDPAQERRPANILIVDDNLASARLMVEALKETQIPHRAKIAYDGEEALAYLRDSGEERPRPDIVLLDFHLPTLGGQEVLRNIKADPDLRAIPVVMLSGSSRPEDIRASYASQANCYVQKPMDLGELVMLLAKISEFWLGYAPRILA